MSGIYIAYAISTCVVLGVWGAIFWRKAPPSQRWLMALLFCLQLPMSWLTYVVVRVPLANWYMALVGKESWWYIFLKSFEAPLTEEPAKLWPLLLPFLFRRIDPKTAFYSGIALGLGFGVSEIWTLVVLYIQSDSSLLARPWYHFVGGIQERFIATFCHAAFTGIAVAGIRQGWRTGIRAVACTMTAHYLLNLPILLPYLLDFAGAIPKTLWLQIVTLYGLVFFIALWIYVWKRLFGHAPRLQPFLGTTVCRGCGRTFVPSLLTLNFVLWTGQRCPHCRQWHLYRWVWQKKTG